MLIVAMMNAQASQGLSLLCNAAILSKILRTRCPYSLRSGPSPLPVRRRLENQLHAELNNSRCDRSRGDVSEGRIRDVRIRITEDCRVERVEKLRAELDIGGIAGPPNSCALHQRGVPIALARSINRTDRTVSETSAFPVASDDRPGGWIGAAQHGGGIGRVDAGGIEEVIQPARDSSRSCQHRSVASPRHRCQVVRDAEDVVRIRSD